MGDMTVEYFVQTAVMKAFRDFGHPPRRLVQPIALQALAAAWNVATGAARNELQLEVLTVKRTADPAVWADLFSRVTTRGARCIPVSRLPQNGFASWLMGSDVRHARVAVCVEQMAEWTRATGLDLAAQMARACIHETGHVLVTPSVFAKLPAAEGYLQPCDPNEERTAWIFTGMCLAMAAADRSHFARKHGLPDDTIGVPF